MRVLAVNKGTSSLKYLLAEVEDGKLAPVTQGEAGSVPEVAQVAGRYRIDAVGHRVVHGGADFVEPVRIDERTLQRLDALADLAPLHNPPTVAVVRELVAALPGPPQFAVFDTAFHASLSEVASTYAVPMAWRRRFGIRRYGFHGLAHRSMAERACTLLSRPPAETRLITLQLGSGASACAIAGGRSVDTSMGLTPAEGLVMATRSGDVDPLLIEHATRMGAGTPEQLWTALECESGLAGLTGEKDMRAVLERADSGDRDAELAVAIVCQRIRKYVGAYLAVLGGADAIVFGGGVGEHAPAVRRRALSGLEELGIEVDEAANRAAAGGDAVISAAGSRVAVVACRVDEESIICRDVAAACESR